MQQMHIFSKFVPHKDAGKFSQNKAAFKTAKCGYTKGMRTSRFKNNAVMRKFNKSE